LVQKRRVIVAPTLAVTTGLQIQKLAGAVWVPVADHRDTDQGCAHSWAVLPVGSRTPKADQEACQQPFRGGQVQGPQIVEDSDCVLWLSVAESMALSAEHDVAGK
jgi:hypothetical protein